MATDSGASDGPDQATPKAKYAVPVLRTPSIDTSRESSPSRSVAKVPANRSKTLRDASPVKNARAKTPGQAIPSIPPASESSGESTPRAGRRIGNENVPRWPSRLKSPPPTALNRSNASPRRPADSSPNREGAASPTLSAVLSIDSVTEEDEPMSSSRASIRGASGTGKVLETVPEATSIAATLSRARSDSTLEEERMVKTSENTRVLSQESGSESGENRDRTVDTVLKPLTRITSRKPDGQNSSMTVETETVTSIPQAPIGTVDRSGGRSDTGSLRMKSSRETIRPKKEKKNKPPRKAATVNTAAGSTNADIFEAQIASAVDEANSTDSEETFVYESNPPEPVGNRSRMHSRTPSSTSMQVYLDQRGPAGRPQGGRNDATASGTAKKSMKFTQNSYNPSEADSKDTDRLDAMRGAGRGNSTSGSHHHLHGQNGRQGRQGAHKSLFAEDAPFYQSKRSNTPSSPRSGLRSAGTTAGKKISRFNTYDMEGEGADDERTPLMNRKRRRPGSSSLRPFGFGSNRRGGFFAKYLGCFIISIMFSLVLLGAVGFLFATTRELEDVSIVEIKNVLASEQELIFDLIVEATNFNVMAVSIYSMNITVFAKTKYLPEKGNTTEILSSRELANQRRALKKLGNVDEGTDPIPDEKPSKTVGIGRVFQFDSPLTFEGTPFRRISTISTGEVQLRKPGNNTDSEPGAWEEIIKHSFDLILRGTFKYQLPLSSKVNTKTVSANVMVHPDQGIAPPRKDPN